MMNAAKCSSTNLFIGNLRKNAFDLIEPRLADRRERDVVTRTASEPAFNGSRFVCGRII